MARTRQRAPQKKTVVIRRRKEPVKHTAQKKKVVVKPAVQYKQMLANCCCCSQKLALGGNGRLCVKCTEFKRHQDAEMRKHVTKMCKKAVELFVPSDPKKPVRVVNMESKSPINATTCIVYRKPDAWNKTDNIIYTAVMDDQALLKGLSHNTRAHRIGNAMNVFHPKSSWVGPVVFMGPNNTTLLPQEIERFKRLIKLF
ncbi:hypothetical protein KAU11_02495 [Candidatus Babeliales bacterium]|nr:hypothetical protein [Candidatus Babeliales bacterium]